MTKYRGYTIEKSSITVSRCDGGPSTKLLIIRDADGYAIRDAQRNYPVITTIEAAKSRIRDEINR